MIRGRMVTLRKLRASDREYLTRWFGDRELMKYYDRLPVYNSAEIETELRQKISLETRHDYLIQAHDGKPVGLTYLDRIDLKNRHCELHVMIGRRNSRNTMLGAESAFLILMHSFRNLNMYKVYARVLEGSENIITLLHDLGFTMEANLKAYFYQGGVYKNLIIYGLMRTEFKAFLSTGKGRKYLYLSQGCKIK